MNAAVLQVGKPRRATVFRPITISRARQIQIGTIPEPAREPHLSTGTSDSLDLLSIDFPAVSTMQLPLVRREPDRGGLLHALQLYTGAALLGSVVCGLAFGWSEHRELIQWIGAGAAILLAIVGRRHAAP